jgi:hypothetical protein
MIRDERRLVLSDDIGRGLVEVEIGILEANQIWMRVQQLHYSAQVEAVIHSAIEHRVQRLVKYLWQRLFHT